MKRFLMLVLGGSLLLLSACTKEDGGGGTISTTAISAMEAQYSTTDGIIPFPNNILFAGSTDGTLNITSGVTDAADITNPTVALNTLDGFSTVAPISTTFAAPIDETTIAAGVRVFEVSTAGVLASYAVTGITSELTMGTHFVALASPSSSNVLVVKPTTALKSNTNYMVVVTSDLKSTSGEAARPSAFFSLLTGSTALVNGSGVSQVPGRDDATAKQLEGLRQLTGAMLAVSGTASPAIAATDVAVAWSFKTQTLGTVLAKIQADSATDPYANSPTNFATVAATPSAVTNNLGILDGATFAAVNSIPAAAVVNIGSVVIGAVGQMPYYLDGSTADPTAALTTTFQVDIYGTPTVKSTQAVPFLLTTPNTAGPWKVAIFQHGFTVDKTAMFGVANTLASQGFATIAIDAVLHGSRTFGLDLVNNTTGAAGADGTADSSGTYYLNLTSLLTSRDNIRQSVADLMHLVQLLKVQTMDIVNNTTGAPGGGDGVDLDVVTPFVYVGHSNGGILGTVLAGLEPATTISKYVLANPGGDYASILQGSGAFGPVVDAGLAAKGVVKGSADYNSFFVAAQTIVDDGDPLNYASLAATKSIFLLKTTPDGVVPNTQTNALSLALSLKQASGNAATVTANAWPLSVVAPPLTTNGFVNYTAGSHSSFLSPTDSATATTAMQTDSVTFLLSGAITTSNTTVTE
ncbi:MAG: hypothetical protein R8M14_04260 [Ghiorsea sp.]